MLDNCEHLLAACAALADSLLRACPQLRILATSREALGIAGEKTYRVPSLSLPDPSRSSRRLGAARRQFEAVRLFVERARLEPSSFARHRARTRRRWSQICRRLDGIPLAIELAAARVKVLPVEQIAARLDDRFRLLTGGSRTALPRQQTLRALIDWSYDLLSRRSGRCCGGLSVFAGGWTLEAAEAVCSGVQEEPDCATSHEQDPSGLNARAPERLNALLPDDVLDLLTSLVEKSLVLLRGGGGASANECRRGEHARRSRQRRGMRRAERASMHPGGQRRVVSAAGDSASV